MGPLLNCGPQCLPPPSMPATFLPSRLALQGAREDGHRRQPELERKHGVEGLGTHRELRHGCVDSPCPPKAASAASCQGRLATCWTMSGVRLLGTFTSQGGGGGETARASAAGKLGVPYPESDDDSEVSHWKWD